MVVLKGCQWLLEETLPERARVHLLAPVSNRQVVPNARFTGGSITTEVVCEAARQAPIESRGLEGVVAGLQTAAGDDAAAQGVPAEA